SQQPASRSGVTCTERQCFCESRPSSRPYRSWTRSRQTGSLPGPCRSIATRHGTCAAPCGDERCWRGSAPCGSWSGGRVSAPKSDLPCCWLVPLQDSFGSKPEQLFYLGLAGLVNAGPRGLAESRWPCSANATAPAPVHLNDEYPMKLWLSA